MSRELNSLIREGSLLTQERYPSRAKRRFQGWVDHARGFLARSGTRIRLRLKFNSIHEDLGKLKRLSSRTPRETSKSRTVFVVYGRNEKVRRAFFEFLRSLGLEPLEWNSAVLKTGRAAPFVGHILDRAFQSAQAIVVLFTPDDVGKLKKCFHTRSDGVSERSLTGQARLNVIFEAGMAFGRFPNRTILVEIGAIRPISDLAGRHVVRFDGSLEKRRDLANRLGIAGCPVNDKNQDWFRAGNFPQIA